MTRISDPLPGSCSDRANKSDGQEYPRQFLNGSP